MKAAKKVATVLGLTVFFSSAAWAMDLNMDGGAKPGEGNGTPIMAKAVSLEEFKARCKNPKDFPQQLAPENIKLQCTDIKKEWIESKHEEVGLAEGRMVSTMILSDKYYVGSLNKSVDVAPRSGTCYRFKPIKTTLTIERGLTCQQLEEMKGAIQDYCQAALDAAGKGSNPKMITVEELNEPVIDTCVNASGKGGKGN